MTVLAHINALHDKHASLEASIKTERLHALPDFDRINQLKKQKLKLKEELSLLEASVPKRMHA